MALNVQGFPLEFDAVINTDTLQLGITTTQDNLTAMIKAIEDSGLKTDAVFLGLKKRFDDLNAAQKILQESLLRSTDPAVNQGYIQSLELIKTEMRDLAVQIKALPTLVAPKVESPTISPIVIPPVEIKINTASLSEQLATVKGNIDILRTSFDNVGIEAGPVLGGLISKFAELQTSAVTFNDAIKNTADPIQLQKYSASLETIKAELTTVAEQINSFPLVSLKFAPTTGVQEQISAVTSNVNQLIETLDKIPGQADPALNNLLLKFAELRQQQIALTEQIKVNASQPSFVVADTGQQQALDQLQIKLKEIAAQINAFPQIKVSGGINIEPAEAQIKTLLGEFTNLGETGTAEVRKLSSSLNLTDQVDRDKKALDDFITHLNLLGGNTGLAKLATQFSQLTAQQLNLKQLLSTETDPVQITKLNNDLLITNNELKKVGQQILTLPKTPDETPQVEKTVQAYQRLRQIKNELVQLTLAGQKGTPEFEQLNIEAEKLTNAIRNTNKELALSAHNVAGLEALKEGVRGLVGGFQAVAGAIAIFGGDSKQAQEATNAVIGAMGILNGVEQVAALLSKNSAVNFYLQGLAHKAAAAGAREQAVATQELVVAEGEVVAGTVAQGAATEALVVAEGEQVVTTEAATVAQEGLNVAMLANPVGIILASLAALFGAYELYIHTIGRVTDAEKEKQAATEALAEANAKSVDTIAKEEASLTTLLITAKSETATKQQREKAINDLSAKYPEYLGQLTTENVLTAKGTELINAQIGVIKQKALVAASEELYTEALKKQITVQNEINRIRAGGETTISQRLATFNQEITHTGILGTAKEADRTEAILKNLTDQLDETKIKTDAVFNGLTDSSNKLTDLYQAPADKLDNLGKTIDFFVQKNKTFIQSLEDLKNQGQPTFGQPTTSTAPKPAFNKQQYDEDFNLAKANIQRKLDITDDANKVQKAHFEKLLADLEESYVKNDETLQNNTAQSNSKIEDATATHLGKIQTLSDEARARAYKANTDAAQANLIQLQALGKQETNAYFDARIKSIKAVAAEQINQERFNAEAIRNIRAKLDLDLKQNEIDRQKSTLQKQLDALQARLNAEKIGSAEELKLRIDIINKQQEIEEDVLDITAQKKLEIESKNAKNIADLIKKYYLDSAKDQINIEESVIQQKLQLVVKGSQDELSLRFDLIDKKAAIDILDAQNSIQNEEKKLAKILEINALALADRKKLEDEFFTKQLKDQFDAIDRASAAKIVNLDLAISKPGATELDKFNAQREKINQALSDTRQKITDIQEQLIHHHGDAAKLRVELDALVVQRDKIQGEIDNDKNGATIAQLQGFIKYAAIASDAFRRLAADLSPVNAALSNLLNTLADVATTAKDASTLVTSILSGDIKGVVTSGVSFIEDILNTIIASSNSKKEAALSLQTYQDSLVTGEIQYNELLRQRAIAQANLNALTLQELQNKQKLLELSKQQAQADFNTLLAQIQLQGKQVTGEHTEKTGGSPLLGAVGSLFGFGTKTKVVQELKDIGTAGFDELEKLFTEGKLDAATAKWFQELKKVHDELDGINQSEKDNQAQLDQLATGTTAQSIADTIAQGFAQGKKSVRDFGDDFSSIMRKSILASFEADALKKPIADFYAQFAAAAETNNLSESKIQELQRQYNAIILNAGTQFDQLKKLTGIDFSSATSSANALVGSIKASLTENTGTVLAGQIGAMRLIGIEQLNTIKNCFTVLNQIANNTARLAAIENYLRVFNTDGMKIK